MRAFVDLITLLFAAPLAAQDWEDQQRFGPPEAARTLRVLSSTDTSFFEPVLESFVRQAGDVAVAYSVTSTAGLDRIFRETPEAFDVVISSAMDLQLKLTNDGYAARLDRLSHPDWAEWRKSLFAFTTEPAAIVINRAAFDGLPVPQTRQDLIEVLRADPERFRNRIGTYDVRQSGLGYLFATQDARASETYWRLMEVMGGLGARLYCCSGDMIDDLANGTLAVAYNVLGSYASARQDTLAELAIVLPSDFPTTMMRTAFVSKEAADFTLAETFVEHLITRQSSGAAAGALPPLTSEDGYARQASISLGPALMTYLDAQKRRLFLRAWESAVIQVQ